MRAHTASFGKAGTAVCFITGDAVCGRGDPPARCGPARLQACYILRCSPLAGGSAMTEVFALRYPQRSPQCQRYKDALIHGISPAALCGRSKEPHPDAPYAAASGRRARRPAGSPIRRAAIGGDRRRRPSTTPTKPARRHHRKMVAPQHRADETGSPAPLGNGVPRCRYRSQRYGIPPQLGAAPDAEAGSGIAARCWMPRVMGWRAGYFFRTGGKIIS